MHRRVKKKIYGIAVLCLSLLLGACALPGDSDGLRDSLEGAKQVLGDTVESTKQKLDDTVENTRQMIGDTVDSVNLPDPKEVSTVSVGKFAYGQLDEEARGAYDQMLDCMLMFDESVTLSTVDTEAIDLAFEAIFTDYGGIFWVDGYGYKTYFRGEQIVGITFSPKYTMSREQRDAYQAEVDSVVDAWLSEIDAGADDFTKSKFVFETLIEKVDYNVASSNNQNILSVFLDGETVCQGYADATAFLLEELGIPAAIISGRANAEAHAWNLVQLDGEYYFIDTTWGNSRYTDSSAATVKHVNYAYLNVTSDELLDNHTIQSSFSIPDCTATTDNYYFHEGLYFDTLDVNAIGQVIADGYYNGAASSSVKMADDALYEQMKQYFITEGHIADFCNGLRSVTFLESEETNVLTIEW